MVQIILNTDETKYGGQGLIEEGQYLQRTINRRYSEFLESFSTFPTLLLLDCFLYSLYSSTYGAIIFIFAELMVSETA